MMSNPEFIRQMTNPSTLQAALQMQQAMQTLQNNGISLPGTTAGGMPGMPGGMAGMPGGFGGMGGSPFGGGMGGLGGGMSGGLDFSSLLNGGAAGGVGGSAAPPVVDAATRFASQLQQLRNMGFVGNNLSQPHVDTDLPFVH